MKAVLEVKSLNQAIDQEGGPIRAEGKVDCLGMARIQSTQPENENCETLNLKGGAS